jgi:hypothetical protein
MFSLSSEAFTPMIPTRVAASLPRIDFRSVALSFFLRLRYAVAIL